MVELAVVRPCEGGSGTEVVPKLRLALDLPRCARGLSSAGLHVVDARVLLVVEDAPRTTVWPTGRMIVQTMDSSEAVARAQDLLRLMGVRD